MAERSTILVTAFEPSGDAHAAPMIERIRALEPDRRIVGLGGPRMAEAGCELLESTVENAAMGLDALGKIRWLRGIVGRLRPRLADLEVAVHVPVDSPAANFPICKLTRPAGARIVHLVAPQLWAWGPWRIGKLRRLTDGVMCLLPFEPAWFAARGVPARFVGHPRLARALDEGALAAEAARLGVTPGAAAGATTATAAEGPRRIVLLPGSRPAEVVRNVEPLVAIADALARRHDDVVIQAAPTSDDVAARVADAARAVGRPIDSYVGALDPVLHGATLALAVSGTVSLDVVRHGVPMIGIYRVKRWQTWLARVLLTAPYRLLPNLIAGERVVPEFVPYAGGVEPMIAAADELLTDDAAAERQRAAMAAIRAQYDGRDPDDLAAACVLSVAAGEPFPTD